MTTASPSTATAEQLLRRRQAELRATLQEAAGTALHAADEPAAPSDFKEVADDEAQDTVSDAATAHALRELAEVDAALLRIREGSYGVCAECGDAIAPARLHAVPAAALCTACQGESERRAAHAS